VTGVYAYEDGAAQSFRAARARGLACVYELPIAYWQTTQRLLHEEAERLPAWRPTLRGLDDSPAKLERKDRELSLADTIVVPSDFVLRSLPARIRHTKRCIVAPFGAPAAAPDGGLAPGGAERPTANGKLRVLFAGALTQRKGLADLFAAVRLLNRSDVELVVMGTPLAPLSFYREQYAGFAYEAPRPHAEVLALMRTCDVLALPALVEGRALVQHEALACGLPVIATPNAGAGDLIVDRETGFLVPIRAPERLAEAIAWCADHRPRLADMRRQARNAAAAAGWDRYEERVCAAARAAVAERGR
jgi:glycosyltransferase involved in cell wall biosynthesis